MVKKLVLLSIGYLIFIQSGMWAENYLVLKVVADQCKVYKANKRDSEIQLMAKKNDRLMAKDMGDWWQILLNSKHASNTPDFGYVLKQEKSVEVIQTVDFNPNQATIADYIKTTRAYKNSDRESQSLMLKYADKLEVGKFDDALTDFEAIDNRLSNTPGLAADTTGVKKDQVTKELLSLHNLFLHKYYILPVKIQTLQNRLFQKKYELMYRLNDKNDMNKKIKSFELEFPIEKTNLLNIKQDVLKRINN